MKLYSALYEEFYPFNRILEGWSCEVVEPGDDLSEPGALIIWGGSDIHPSLYNRPKMGSYVSDKPSMRDLAEWALAKEAVKKGTIILGVCRGAQMGCALAGGILVQDVDGHGMTHWIDTVDGASFTTSSIHHQMMYPWGVKHDLIAWNSAPGEQVDMKGLTTDEFYQWPKQGDKYIEPEIVWFPTIKCLAVQGHPEMMHWTTGLNNYLKTLVRVKCSYVPND